MEEEEIIKILEKQIKEAAEKEGISIIEMADKYQKLIDALHYKIWKEFEKLK